MRWWLYDGKKTTGPFSREDLARLDALSPEAPLCREYVLGSPEETWLRAVDVKEIAPLFPPALRERAKAKAEPEGKPGPWPPDPAGRDVDAYRSVQRRMEIVDRSIAAAQDRITLRTERFHKLQSELDRRLDTAAALEDSIRAMAAKIGGFVGLREELDQARAAMAMQEKRIAELHEQMKELETSPEPPAPPEPPPPGPPPAEASRPPREAEPGRKGRRAPRRSGSERTRTDPFETDLPNADFETGPPDAF